MKCKFAVDINKCLCFVSGTLECTKKTSCSYQVPDDPERKYVRGERWYEKYYKGISKPIKE